MRAYDNGSYFSVTCSRHDVEAFRRSWPCCELSGAPRWFQFDKSNGDLVDTNIPQSQDGSAALALSHDALAYGVERLKLPDWFLTARGIKPRL